ATTRVTVEDMVQANPSRSLVRWLDNVADLLERKQPAAKRGAPRSISQVFVSRIARIWRELGLNPGLAYNFFLHPARVPPSLLRVGRVGPAGGGRVWGVFSTPKA